MPLLPFYPQNDQKKKEKQRHKLFFFSDKFFIFVATSTSPATIARMMPRKPFPDLVTVGSPFQCSIIHCNSARATVLFQGNSWIKSLVMMVIS